MEGLNTIRAILQQMEKIRPGYIATLISQQAQQHLAQLNQRFTEFELAIDLQPTIVLQRPSDEDQDRAALKEAMRDIDAGLFPEE